LGESRKRWLLAGFKMTGKQQHRTISRQFWQVHKLPLQGCTTAFIHKKYYYLHHNPVAAGMVYKAKLYLYSSARCCYTAKLCGLLLLMLL
jgi:hypothetical protein